MEEALRTKLLATAALTALVAGRVTWGLRPQGSSLPAVTLHLISGAPGMNFAGPTGWTRTRVQIDCWADTHKAARDIADAIGGKAGALTGFRGAAGPTRLRTFIIARRSSDEAGAASTPIHRTSLDALVWHDA